MAKLLSKAELAEKVTKLQASLREMLDCYWGEGDGSTPPKFIKRALRLVK